MYIHRKTDIELEKWKAESNHKPLLIRGARQVGKTKTIREFGKQFDVFIEINFKESPRLKTLFQDQLSPAEICVNIFMRLSEFQSIVSAVVFRKFLLYDVCLYRHA